MQSQPLKRADQELPLDFRDLSTRFYARLVSPDAQVPPESFAVIMEMQALATPPATEPEANHPPER